MSTGCKVVIDHWKSLFAADSLGDLKTILHKDCVFHSPVVHTPQLGRELTEMYLTAAYHVIKNENFEYVREFYGSSCAVLEFSSELDGIFINGVDMIEWDSQGKIVDFKVMVRPQKALATIHSAMGEALEKLTLARLD